MLREAGLLKVGHALRHPQHRAGAPRQPGAARAQALRARHRLHRQGRQGRHHRRVHRPHDGRPALFRGPAPGARGQGRRRHPEREPDARLDHLPELFPPLSQARRHDRHGDDRGERVRRDLQARRHRDPDQRADASASTTTTRSIAPAREKYEAIVDADRRNAASASSRCWSARSASRSPRRSSALLKKRKIPHQVLNARYHEQEAYIIAQAGRPGAVTIATNMAGRGTDIQLGGNLDMRLKPGAAPSIADEAAARRSAPRRSAPRSRPRTRRCVQAGGLFVIGTERHESRRIDNQLRGRSGRQGDPGASKFFLSLEDDLMRIFGSERMDGMLQQPRPQGGRGDHPSLDQQGAREGAAEGRGAQLRDPQAPAANTTT